jgi:DNA-binding NtrC family response regulator
MPQIVALTVGRDPLLAETRSQVLRRDGYVVVKSLSVQQALKDFVAGDFDIVLLCHTIPPEDRELLVKAIHSRRPNVPVVLVAGSFGAQLGTADAAVDSDPASLLSEIPKLVLKSSSKARPDNAGPA